MGNSQTKTLELKEKELETEIERYITSQVDTQQFLDICNEYLYNSITYIYPEFRDLFLWSALTFFRRDKMKLYTSKILTSDNYSQHKNWLDTLSKWLNKGISEQKFASYTYLLLNQRKSKNTIVIESEELSGLLQTQSETKINLTESISIPQLEIDTQKAKRILRLEQTEEKHLEKLKPFILAYERISNHDDVKKIFIYILPNSYYSEKFSGLYFICLNKDQLYKKEWLSVVQLYLHKLFSIRVDVANVKFPFFSKYCLSTTYEIVPQSSCHS